MTARTFALVTAETSITLTAADAVIRGAGLRPGAAAVMQTRLSLTGRPMAEAGDWQSTKTNAKLPGAALTLTIDELVKN